MMFLTLIPLAHAGGGEAGDDPTCLAIAIVLILVVGGLLPERSR